MGHLQPSAHTREVWSSQEMINNNCDHTHSSYCFGSVTKCKPMC